jgi:hypothetical protein
MTFIRGTGPASTRGRLLGLLIESLLQRSDSTGSLLAGARKDPEFSVFVNLVAPRNTLPGVDPVHQPAPI